MNRLRARLGWKPISEEDRGAQLESNLDDIMGVSIIDREEKLRLLGFEDISHEQRMLNLASHFRF